MSLSIPRQRRNVPVWPMISLIVIALSACAGAWDGPARTLDENPDTSAATVPAVRTGLEVLLDDSLGLVVGRRVGLVTNQTGIDREGVSSIDRLVNHPEVDLVALFSPEHGIRGEAQAGVQVASGRDSYTGLPVHSLYGDTRKPTPEMLEGLDVLLFDIQDIGARYYTYVSTMALAMEAAGEAGIPFVILDRPNPIGGVAVQGTVLDPAFSTFVGLYPTPMRHGMTPGELARMMVGEFGIAADLTVIPAAGWTRPMSFEETELPWIAPSPSMPSVESALHYPGTCLFEGTSLSVGRGTSRAFQQIGAPWIDAPALSASMEALGLPGVRFEPTTFVPDAPGDGKFAGTDVHGVRLIVLDEDLYDPTRTAVGLLVETYRMSGSNWSWRESHFDRLAGTATLREGIASGASLGTLTDSWDADLAAFRERRLPYLLYPE